MAFDEDALNNIVFDCKVVPLSTVECTFRLVGNIRITKKIRKYEGKDYKKYSAFFDVITDGGEHLTYASKSPEIVKSMMRALSIEWNDIQLGNNDYKFEAPSTKYKVTTGKSNGMKYEVNILEPVRTEVAKLDEY